MTPLLDTSSMSVEYAPFYERAPANGSESPLIVEIPHAGLLVPPEVLCALAVPAKSLARDADLFVDELFAGAPGVGASMLVARLSRYVVDLNRSELDIDGETVIGVQSRQKAPRGVVWRLSGDGETALVAALTPRQFELRMASFYRPYHHRLRTLIEAAKARFGYAVVLAAHSMPSFARRGLRDDSARADIVPGTRGRTSAAAIYIDTVDRFFCDRGLAVRHDVPYSGGFTTAHYGAPLANIHVVQLEIARRLYMDEDKLTRTMAPMAELAAMCTALCQQLAAIRPG
jgi:N-formylglutamate deformylase